MRSCVDGDQVVGECVQRMVETGVLRFEDVAKEGRVSRGRQNVADVSAVERADQSTESAERAREDCRSGSVVWSRVVHHNSVKQNRCNMGNNKTNWRRSVSACAQRGR